eukprot:6457677-Amphidinium_carterae.2
MWQWGSPQTSRNSKGAGKRLTCALEVEAGRDLRVPEAQDKTEPAADDACELEGGGNGTCSSAPNNSATMMKSSLSCTEEEEAMSRHSDSVCVLASTRLLAPPITRAPVRRIE